MSRVLPVWTILLLILSFVLLRLHYTIDYGQQTDTDTTNIVDNTLTELRSLATEPTPIKQLMSTQQPTPAQQPTYTQQPTAVRLLAPKPTYNPNLILNSLFNTIPILSGRSSFIDFNRKQNYHQLDPWYGTFATVVHLIDHNWPPSPSAHLSKGIMLHKLKDKSIRSSVQQTILFYPNKKYHITFEWKLQGLEQIYFFMFGDHHIIEFDQRLVRSEGPIKTSFLYQHWQTQGINPTEIPVKFIRSLSASGNKGGLVFTALKIVIIDNNEDQQLRENRQQCLTMDKQQKVTNPGFLRKTQRGLSFKKLPGWSGSFLAKPKQKYTNSPGPSPQPPKANHQPYIIFLQKTYGSFLKQRIHNLIVGNRYLLSITFVTLPRNTDSIVKVIFDRIILNDDVTYQSSQFAYHSYFALFYARHTEGTLYIVNNRKGQKFYGIGVATVSIVEQQNSCLTHTSLFRSGYNTRRESQRDKEKDDLNTLLGTLSGTSGTSASTSASGIMRASSIRSSVSTRASTRASTRRMSLDLDTTKSDEFELTQAEELEQLEDAQPQYSTVVTRRSRF